MRRYFPAWLKDDRVEFALELAAGFALVAQVSYSITSYLIG